MPGLQKVAAYAVCGLFVLEVERPGGAHCLIGVVMRGIHVIAHAEGHIAFLHFHPQLAVKGGVIHDLCAESIAGADAHGVQGVLTLPVAGDSNHADIGLGTHLPAGIQREGFRDFHPYRELPDVLRAFIGMEDAFILIVFGIKGLGLELVITHTRMRNDIQHIGFDQVLAPHARAEQHPVDVCLQLVACFQPARLFLVNIVAGLGQADVARQVPAILVPVLVQGNAPEAEIIVSGVGIAA